MGIRIPRAKALEPLEEKTAILWGTEEEGATAEESGFLFSGTNNFKSGKGEFLAIGQGDDYAVSEAKTLHVKSPADSGSSIDSKFEGKSAVIGTSTTKENQEAFVAAGGEFKTLLNNAGKSDFLQLAAGLGNHKIAFGATGTKEFAAASTAAFGFKHGLGTTPVIALAVADRLVGGGILFSVTTGSFTSTEFVIQWTTIDASTATKCAAYWLAIG